MVWCHMNGDWKGFRRKLSWASRRTFTKFTWKDYGKLWKACQETQCFSRVSNREAPEYKSKSSISYHLDQSEVSVQRSHILFLEWFLELWMSPSNKFLWQKMIKIAKISRKYLQWLTIIDFLSLWRFTHRTMYLASGVSDVVKFIFLSIIQHVSLKFVGDIRNTKL
jgi:hypothetical protein